MAPAPQGVDRDEDFVQDEGEGEEQKQHGGTKKKGKPGQIYQISDC